MQIDIPQGAQARLAQLAVDAGYQSVELFVTEHVLALAHYPRVVNLGPLSEEELRASLDSCDRGMAEIDAGGGRDAREALLEIGRRRGFSLDG
jgi:hypothetical protein